MAQAQSKSKFALLAKLAASEGSSVDTAIDGLLLGSIGVLAHSSEIQWNAFNQALREKLQRADLAWDRESYVESLQACGGRKRLAAFLASKGVTASEDDIEDIYQRKTAIFVAHIREHGLTIRPGVVELLQEARAQGLKTATVSSTPKEVLQALLQNTVPGTDLGDLLDLVVSGDDAWRFGGNPKPAPDCYLYAKQALGLSNPIVVEDTQISMEAAVRAMMPCVAAPSEWAVGQDFSKAVLRVKELSELGAVMGQK